MASIATNQALLKDSIDKYGPSDCEKRPFSAELINSFKKAIDSAWNILLADGKTSKFPIIHSKDKFKEALITNHFTVDSSQNWVTATKRGFNERWRAEWRKDSNCVQLVLTRWSNGCTYDFMIGSNQFDQ